MVFDSISVCTKFHSIFIPRYFFISFQVPSLYVIKGIIILDNDGNRILAKVNLLGGKKKVNLRNKNAVNFSIIINRFQLSKNRKNSKNLYSTKRIKVQEMSFFWIIGRLSIAIMSTFYSTSWEVRMKTK